MIKKKFLTLALSLALCGSAIAGIITATSGHNSARAEYSYADAFEFSDGEAKMKYKTAVNGGDRTGLLFYSYAKGATAKFKSGLAGDFEAEFALLADGASPDLKTVSFIFDEMQGDKSFKVTLNYGENGNCNVEYGGEKAGVVYASDGKAYNYTALYNRDGKYTEFSPKGTTKIKFDYAGKKVYVAGNGGSQTLVWDFTQKTMDGKTLVNDVSDMGAYNVSVCFDDVKTGGKAQLLAYKFGGITLDKATVDGVWVLSADYKVKALVGEPYALATPRLKDALTNEEKDASTVKTVVYNESDEVLTVTNGKFIPEDEGKYFIWYSVNDGAQTAYYMIDAVNRGDIKTEYAADKSIVGSVFGVNAVVYVPKMTVKSNYSLVDATKYAVVTVKFNGEAVSGYENVSGGFDYSLSKAGEYEFCYSVPEFNGSFGKTLKVTADTATVAKVIEDIPSAIEVGETVDIVPAKIYLNGTEEVAETYIIDPLGNETKGNSFVAQTLGTYKVEHRWSGGVERFEVEAKNKYSDLFTVGKNSSVSYGTMAGNNAVKGQLLRLANNSKVTYNKVIDLAAINFNDTLENRLLNKPLIEFIAQPNTAGRADLSGLYIVLADKYDEENAITIRLKYMDYNPDNMRVRVKAKGQGYAGYYYDGYGNIEVHNAQSHEDGGFIVQSSFVQNVLAGHDMLDDSVKLYYNQDETTLYAEPWDWSKPVMKTWAVRRFGSADRFYGCGDAPWRGFKTGEVYMSIYAMGVESTADIMVTKIGGESVDDSFVSDKVAPTITVDADENAVPFGQVEKAYKLFDYSVNDAYSAVAEKGVKVTFNGNEVAVTNNGFVPKAAGEYIITYYGKDAYGNVAEKSFKVTVKQKLDAPEITIGEGLPTTAFVGQKIALPEFSAKGAGVKTSAEVYCNGEKIKSADSFICAEEGVYMVKFIATPHVGEAKAITKYITVSYGENPVFDDTQIVLPAAFIDGEEYTFGEYNAYIYTENGKKTVKAEITVTDGNGEKKINGAYTPKVPENGGNAKIEFAFDVNGNRTVVEKSVPVKKISQKLGFLKEYFVSENGEITVSDKGVIAGFDGSADKNSLAFIRAVDEEKFSVNLVVKTDKTGYKSFIFNLRSATDSNKHVKYFVENRNGAYYGSVDGKNYVLINLNDNDELVVAYSPSKKAIVDCYNSVIAQIGKNADGSAFDGFGGKIYFDVELQGITSASAIGVSVIANQGFNNNRSDKNAPYILLSGGLSGNYVTGDKVIIPAARAYDVLTPSATVTLTVSVAGKVLESNVSCSEEREYVLTELGEYEFAYTSKDARNNPATTKLYLSVSDLTKPALTFSGNMPETVKKGETVTLPSYTTSKDGLTVKVYYSAPDSLMRDVKDGKITFNRAGNYKVYYVVDDGNGNFAYYSFTVTAK